MIYKHILIKRKLIKLISMHAWDHASMWCACCDCRWGLTWRNQYLKSKQQRLLKSGKRQQRREGDRGIKLPQEQINVVVSWASMAMAPLLLLLQDSWAEKIHQAKGHHRFTCFTITNTDPINRTLKAWDLTNLIMSSLRLDLLRLIIIKIKEQMKIYTTVTFHL